jgi:Flp pilus assembly protein TadD
MRALEVVLSFVLFITTSSRKMAIKKIDEAQLETGYWLVLLGGSKCGNCSAVKRVLSKVAPEFHLKIKFGYLEGSGIKRYGVQSQSDVAKILLFPNQGSGRYIPCTEQQTAQDIKYFLHYYLADNALRQSQIETALEEFNKALLQRPTSAVTHFGLANLHHQHTRDLTAAASHYDKALLDEAALPSVAQAHYLAANTYLTLGYPEKALRHYDTAVRADPKLYGAHREMAIAAGLQDDAVAAEEALRRAIAIRPDDPDSLTDLASLLLDRCSRRECVVEPRQGHRSQCNKAPRACVHVRGVCVCVCVRACVCACVCVRGACVGAFVYACARLSVLLPFFVCL